jgi:hypothetical protein
VIDRKGGKFTSRRHRIVISLDKIPHTTQKGRQNIMILAFILHSLSRPEEETTPFSPNLSKPLG